MYLDKDKFTTVIEATPLISIDLVIESAEGKVLLGLRNNKPAKGYWFVPGGRVRKSETLDQAFTRLCKDELGLAMERAEAELLGPYEHFYSDFVFGDEISTHYVVLAYKIKVDLDITKLPCAQHNQYRWFTPKEMRERDDVHQHSQWYIQS